MVAFIAVPAPILLCYSSSDAAIIDVKGKGYDSAAN